VVEVLLVAHTPNPVEVCGRAAGICWDKEEKENYDDFIRRIIKVGHESVIEHAVFTFRVEGISRACSHQWVRHRICSFSQRSQRFVREDEMSYVIPSFDYLERHARDDANAVFAFVMKDVWDAYSELLSLGVKPEDARFVLPNACETKIYWTANARELRHFFKLRLSKHAQWEIRILACKIYDLVVKVAPALFDDLNDLRGQ